MRRHGKLAVGTAAALMVLATTGTAQAGGGDREVIRVDDDCHPQSFNDAIGEGTCDPAFDGGTTFLEFLAEFEKKGEVGAWRFNPQKTHVDHGTPLYVEHVGGEVHTFTPVERFGGGCVEELNHGEPMVPECSDMELFGSTLISAGQHVTVETDELDHGAQRYMCLIHPWMRTVVHVEHDHD